MLMRRSLLCTLLLLLASACAAAQDTWQKECAELAVLLQWHPGDTVADIGAGKGKLTSMTAVRVGPSGRVYSTEMDSEKLAALQELAAKQSNITPIKASDSATNVPDLSCDSIYMRLVYHHFTKPSRDGLQSVPIFKARREAGNRRRGAKQGLHNPGGCSQKPTRARDS